ncbi:Cysteinyl-tRNA synthetase [Hordeum vulgare]|nr:Cysteinyl-tRNA synthetase [Hordeum vulgare]
MKVADPREDETASGFNIAEANAEFAAAQVEEMAEQHDILESIQNEVEVEANRKLIRQKQAKANALFNELDTKIATEEAGAERAELQVLPMYPLEGTEIVDIFNQE